MFTIDIDVSEVVRAWNEAERELNDDIRRSVTTACREGASEARNTHRYQDRTGRLTQSIDYNTNAPSSREATGEIVATMPYASFVDGGTEPHVIERRKAKALRWESGGEVRFAQKVQHPGTQPDAFMGRALQKSERVLIREIEVAVDKAAQKMNR